MIGADLYEYVYDLEVATTQLLFFVRAFEPDFGNGFKEDTRKINSIIDPLLFKLNLDLEFFIFRDMAH